MRTFEIISLITLFFTLVSIFISPLKRPKWMAFLPSMALLASVFSIIMEKYRWQMGPAYIFIVIVFVINFEKLKPGYFERIQTHPPKRRYLAVISAIMGLVIFIVVFTIPFLFPVFTMPEPTGPHSIGTKYFEFVDDSRLETFTKERDDKRKVFVQAWYPAVITKNASPRYYWNNAREMSRRFGELNQMPAFLLSYLGLIKTHSFLDESLAQSNQPFPVLIFSHGYMMLHTMNTALMEELASRGYVVFSIAHAYDASFYEKANGEVIFYGFDQGIAQEMDEKLSLETMDKLVNTKDFNSKVGIYNQLNQKFPKALESIRTRAKDISFLIDKLEKMNENDRFFAGKLDMGKIGVMGMSFGGAAAAQACLTDKRCKAGVNLDGQIVGDLFENSWSFPFLFLTSEQAAKRVDNHIIDPYDDVLFQKAASPSYMISIKGTTHMNFSDWSLFDGFAKLTGMLGEINGKQCLQIQNECIRVFFDICFKNKDKSILKNLPGQYPVLEVIMK